jgi:hypothetical protein
MARTAQQEYREAREHLLCGFGFWANGPDGDSDPEGRLTKHAGDSLDRAVRGLIAEGIERARDDRMFTYSENIAAELLPEESDGD